eukprot:780722-Pyramimonas_sp.AAC.1
MKCRNLVPKVSPVMQHFAHPLTFLVRPQEEVDVLAKRLHDLGLIKVERPLAVVIGVEVLVDHCQAAEELANEVLVLVLGAMLHLEYLVENWDQVPSLRGVPLE